jgi:predicted transcriptional regulator of viral defense system
MHGLSKKEMKLVSELDYMKKNYFTVEDIKHLFRNKRQIINTFYTLRKKGRIVSLNKNKYFLVPIKARKGVWTDHPLIIADEMLNGDDYFIGGWYAAYYWKLTEQIPAQVDIYTTKRQGKIALLNKRFVFHRTSKQKIDKSTIQTIEGHNFKIISKEDAKKWIKSRR